MPVALTYFWGLTLSVQGILTPSLAEAFPDPRFLAFWAMHFLIVWAALYLTFGLGLGPGWREYRVTVAVTARVGGPGLRLRRRARRQLRLPQPQARLGVAARPARPVAGVRARVAIGARCSPVWALIDLAVGARRTVRRDRTSTAGELGRLTACAAHTPSSRSGRPRRR